MSDKIRKVVDIDEYQLDKECVNLPTDILKYSSILAKKKRNYDSAKSNLENVEAKLQMEIREDPSKFGLDKVTENAIKSALVLNEDYKKAKEQVLQAKYEMDVSQAVVNALEAKKKSLAMLVDLYLVGYFSEMKADPVSKQAVEEVIKNKVRKRTQVRVKRET